MEIYELADIAEADDKYSKEERAEKERLRESWFGYYSLFSVDSV